MTLTILVRLARIAAGFGVSVLTARLLGPAGRGDFAAALLSGWREYELVAGDEAAESDVLVNLAQVLAWRATRQALEGAA